MSTTNGKHGVRARGAIEDFPIALTVAEAAAILGIGRTAAYEAIRAGIIPHFRVGRHVRVSRDRLFEWVEQGGQAQPEVSTGTGARPRPRILPRCTA